MSEPKPRRCMYCRQRTVVPATLQEYRLKVANPKLLQEKWDVVARDVKVLRCAECGEMVWTDDTSEAVDKAIAEHVATLKPEIAEEEG